jgi:hypothetical protein
MNCDELARVLESTLIRERDPRWLDEARRHAQGCSACARLLELHRVEEHLTALPAIEPSGLFLEGVMGRVAQHRPAVVRSFRGSLHEWLEVAAVLVGATLLAAAYLVPATGKSWFSNLWTAPALIRPLGISAYLGQHPLWAIHLAGLATLMIVLGMTVPERPVRGNVSRA